MWGQVCSASCKDMRSRIIPTRVGTRISRCASSKMVKDHPHACGDKKLSHPCSSDAGGSSPRVWGQVARGEHQQVRYGIIPTRVGTRCAGMSKGAKEKDHPHACGDKTQKMIEKKYCEGSSPRVWGQALTTLLLYSGFRIIPTRVGTSLFPMD